MTLAPDKLRKAAVLVASLDEAAAGRLLAQMGPALAARVKAAVGELGPIAPAERKTVIAEFLAQPEQNESQRGQVELELSPAARRQMPRLERELERPAPRGRFGFLHEMTGETLADALADESPQTAAVVLSHLEPHHAAEVLAHCDPTRQTDLLRRVANLEEMHPDILAEIEQHLQTLFADHLRSERRRREGTAVVSAIVAAAGPLEGAAWLERLSRADRGLASSVQGKKKSGRPVETEATDRAGPGKAAVIRRDFVGAGGQVEPPLEFRELEQLDNRSLAVLLRAADPQIALLALTGASRSLVLRILRELSTSDADLLEQRMQRIGPVRLRDVETAQEMLARLAGQLAAKRQIQLPQRAKKLAMVA